MSSELNDRRVDTSGLQKGMYVVEVEDGENRYSKKLLVK
jgi:hypothetical protein